MLVFPQLSTGASAQYPLGKRVSQRSVQSAMEDGTILSLADPCATYIRWKVRLEELSDPEAATFENFFVSTQGMLQPFLFLDPTANLLVWSSDFTQSAWTAPGVTFDSSVADPGGGAGAQRAYNRTAASLSIAQQSQIPGMIRTCFSVYLRADAATAIPLTVAAGSASETLSVAVRSEWGRFQVSSQFAGVTDSLQYAIQLPPATTIEIYGPQVDAQPASSCYVATSGRSGVYSNARFDAPQIERIVTGPNRNSCVMYVRSNFSGGD